jgi:hypothetical protein
MTVSNTTSRNQYTATSGQTVFPYTFEIFDKGDVVVLKNGTALSEGTNYTVSGVGNDNGGNITLTVGATAGDILTIYRDMAYQRTTDYQTSGDFLAQEVNDDFDRLWLAVQQNEQANDRAIVKPITDAASIDMTLPSAADRANSYLTFDATGAPSVVAAGDPSAPDAITRQDFTGDGSTVVYTLASAPGAAGAGVMIFIDGIQQDKDSYTITGTTLTFSEAPPLNSNINLVQLKATSIGEADSASVTYIPAGTGAVQTSVQSKLRETVSVKDFGAVGDGVTDDIDALNLAASYGANKTIYVPPGIYMVSRAWNILSNTNIVCDGTIKFISTSGGDYGHVVGIFNPTGKVENVTWTGGIIDVSDTQGQNGLGIGGFYGAVRNIRISNILVKGAAWSNTIFGGKGITIQHDCQEITLSDFIVLDSYIGLSIEGTGLPGEKPVNNISISNGVISNCSEFGFYGAYSFTPIIKDSEQLSCLINNISFNNCADDYLNSGVINVDRMNALKMTNISIISENRVTPLRGNLFNSHIEFSVDANDIHDVINMKASDGTPSGNNLAPSDNCYIKARVNANTQIHGAIVTYDNIFPKIPTKCFFDVSYNTPTGPATLMTSGIGSDCQYSFKRMSDGKITAGSCNNVPTFTSQGYKLFYDQVVMANGLLVQDAITQTRIQPLIGQLIIKENSGATVVNTRSGGINITGNIQLNNGPLYVSGTGTPEGAITAPVGSLFVRTDGGAGTSFYVKESGTGNTGWVAK